MFLEKDTDSSSADSEDNSQNGGNSGDDDRSASAEFSSINSLAAERPKFKFSDLLGEDGGEKAVDSPSAANSRQTPPDSFKFFAAVPGSAAT